MRCLENHYINKRDRIRSLLRLGKFGAVCELDVMCRLQVFKNILCREMHYCSSCVKLKQIRVNLLSFILDRTDMLIQLNGSRMFLNQR